MVRRNKKGFNNRAFISLVLLSLLGGPFYCAAFPSVVSAEERKDLVEFRLYAMYSGFPGERDAQIWPRGWGLGVWTGIELDPRVTLGLRLDYSIFNADTEAFAAWNRPPNTYSYVQFNYGTASISFVRMIPSLKLNFVTDPLRPVRPYVVVGVGFMNKSFDETNISGLDFFNNPYTKIIPGYSDTVPMASVIVGMPVKLPEGFRVPLELELSNGFTTDKNTVIYTGMAGIERQW